MSRLNEIIGANIRWYRKKNKLTQCQLAKMIFSNNLSVHNWESGAALPTAHFLKALADVFKCSIDDLFSDNPL